MSKRSFYQARLGTNIGQVEGGRAFSAGGIHGSNAGSLLPVYITSNIFHNITAYQNGGIGVYLDVSSTGVQVERNLVYDVSAEPINWNVNPVGKRQSFCDAIYI